MRATDGGRATVPKAACGECALKSIETNGAEALGKRSLERLKVGTEARLWGQTEGLGQSHEAGSERASQGTPVTSHGAPKKGH